MQSKSDQNLKNRIAFELTINYKLPIISIRTAKTTYISLGMETTRNIYLAMTLGRTFRPHRAAGWSARHLGIISP